jgi:hypothetical protein
MTPVVNLLTNLKKLISFKEWFDDLFHAKRTDSRQIAKRVLRVFDVHNISVAKIPVVFPNFHFKIKNFNTLDTTVSVLTPEFLSSISEHFFINQEWLETGRGPVQKVQEYGYDFRAIFDVVKSIDNHENVRFLAYFIAKKNTQFVPAYDHGTDETVAVVIELIHEEATGFKYSRYFPLYTGFWHYYKTRMMLKSVSLLLFQDTKFITQKGHYEKNLNENYFDHKFAIELVNSSQGIWHPDDYIFCHGMSAQEKDPIDAKRMHDFLKHISFYNQILNLRPCNFIKNEH